ncbi:MAG: CDP-glycerol glycerophosphotransferase family protein [Actinobacteria bacterium]|nr:CDP-glycerol glycerophosphotransferase family protein [Actinomycetota bacterium]
MPTTTFSVIVPVYNVRVFLAECLDSVLSQAGDDVEVIAVDDRSTDGSADILRSYEHPALRTVLLPENVGLGRARNAGIEAARGEYLLFLDSDDVLADGAIDAIRARIEATGRPEVLHYDYARLYWDRGAVRNVKADLLRRGEALGVFTIDAFPGLLQNFNSAWNKAYRRDLVDRLGLRFLPGYYEDISWTMRVMLEARSIACLDRVCLLYRQRVSGSILRSRTDKHFDAFDQWTRVYEENDVAAHTPAVQAALYDYMLGQLRTVFDAGGRLPASSRRRWYRQMGAVARERKPDVVPPAHRGKRLRRAAAERDLWAVDRALDAVRAVPRRAELGAGRVRTAARAVAVPEAREEVARRVRFRSARKNAVDQSLVVFSAYWHRSVSCNPYAIYEELARRRPDLRLVWGLDPRLGGTAPDGVDVLDPRSDEYWLAVATAGTLVNNVNFEMTFQKRPGQRFLQTQHGTPLKSMGLDLHQYPQAAAGFTDFAGLLRRISQWDYLLSSNRFSTLVWERCMPGHYETLELGYPRNDVLVRGDDARALRVREQYGVADGQRVVLYAPTMRDGDDAFRSPWDLDRAASSLADDDVLLVRGHYLTTQDGPAARGRRVIDVRQHPSVEDLYLAADVLVTDYSSTMFDFANTGKPIVIYAPDYDEYRRTRGMYFELRDENAGVFTEDEGALHDALADRAALVAAAEGAAYRAFRDRFCEFDDGHAAERVVDLLFPSS